MASKTSSWLSRRLRVRDSVAPTKKGAPEGVTARVQRKRLVAKTLAGSAVQVPPRSRAGEAQAGSPPQGPGAAPGVPEPARAVEQPSDQQPDWATLFERLVRQETVTREWLAECEMTESPHGEMGQPEHKLEPTPLMLKRTAAVTRLLAQLGSQRAALWCSSVGPFVEPSLSAIAEAHAMAVEQAFLAAVPRDRVGTVKLFPTAVPDAAAAELFQDWEAGARAISAQVVQPRLLAHSVEGPRYPYSVSMHLLHRESTLVVGPNGFPGHAATQYVPKGFQPSGVCAAAKLVVGRDPGMLARRAARVAGRVAWQSRCFASAGGTGRLLDVQAGDFVFSVVGTACADSCWSTGDYNLGKVCGLGRRGVFVRFVLSSVFRRGSTTFQLAVVTDVSVVSSVFMRHPLFRCCSPDLVLQEHYKGSNDLVGATFTSRTMGPEATARAAWLQAEVGLPQRVVPAFEAAKRLALQARDWGVNPMVVREELISAWEEMGSPAGPGLQA